MAQELRASFGSRASRWILVLAILGAVLIAGRVVASNWPHASPNPLTNTDGSIHFGTAIFLPNFSKHQDAPRLVGEASTFRRGAVRAYEAHLRRAYTRTEVLSLVTFRIIGNRWRSVSHSFMGPMKDANPQGLGDYGHLLPLVYGRYKSPSSPGDYLMRISIGKAALASGTFTITA